MKARNASTKNMKKTLTREQRQYQREVDRMHSVIKHAMKGQELNPDAHAEYQKRIDEAEARLRHLHAGERERLLNTLVQRT